jgi:hypothetical protein
MAICFACLRVTEIESSVLMIVRGRLNCCKQPIAPVADGEGLSTWIDECYGIGAEVEAAAEARIGATELSDSGRSREISISVKRGRITSLP